MCSVQHLSPASLLLHYSNGIYRTFQAGAFVVWKRGLAHSELPTLLSVVVLRFQYVVEQGLEKPFQRVRRQGAYCILVVNEC